MSVPTKFYLFKRNNGIYYYGYLEDGRKRWKSIKCRRKDEALKVLTDVKSLLHQKPPVQTVTQFIGEFLPYGRVNLQPKTVDGYEAALRQLASLSGDIPLAAVTRRHIDAFKGKRLEKVKPATLNIELRSLRAAFNVALRWGLIEKNPFAKVQLARIPQLPPTYLSQEDFVRLLALIQEKWLKELMLFAVSTGLRRGEMVNLRWEDVDLVRRIIHIQSHEGFRTKNGKYRIIPLNDAVYNLLVEKAKQTKKEYVFTRRGYKMGESYITHRFKYYVRKAELSENIRWHSLRHTHASWLVQKGASLYEVQKLLGHSSSKVTEIYSHLQPEQLHDTVNKIKIELN